MKLMEIGTLQSDHLIKALFNTLLHSLWQGILLAIVTGLIIICTKKAKAAFRYNLLIAALVLFAAGAVFTFAQQLGRQSGQPSYQFNNSTAAPGAVNIPAAPIAEPVVNAQNTKMSVIATVTGYLNEYYSTIILIWFLIICAKSVQMAVGVYGIFQLKNNKVFTVDEYWTARLQQLSEKLQVKQAVALLESGLAKVPMVVGHLKPVILIPIGLINSLPANEVEAILVHELAHIRRKDYLVNFLQSFMEIIFFFNPAVLWISQLIKEERENCCDDIAIEQTTSKVNYLNALVNCSEYQTESPAYSMALAGSKNKLINRVKRVISNRNQSLNLVEKTLLTVCLVCVGLFIVAFSAKKVTAHHLSKGAKTVTAPAKTVVIDPQIAIHPPNSLNNSIGSAAAGQAKSDTTNNAHIRVYSSKDFGDGTTMKTFVPGNNGKTIVAYIFKREGVFYQINMDKGHLLSFLIDEKAVPASQLQSYQPKIDELLNEYRLEELKNSGNPDAFDLSNKATAINNQNSANAGADVLVLSNQSGGQNVNAHQNTGYYSNDVAPYRSTIPDFGDTLVKYGVIKDKRHVHAVFNNQGLVINGVKQPDDVYRMLLKKYVTKPGGNVNITYTNNGLPDERMEQQAYWEGQQRKIIAQMAREGLINNQNNVSFTLTDKTFVINGFVQNGEVFQKYRQEYVPADAGDNWTWNYNSAGGNYSAGENRYRNSSAYYQSNAAERQRIEAERDKKLVADLLQDGLITDANNVTFTLSDKKLEINGKKQSEELYKKYKDKYLPNNTGGTWSWTYSHHE
jgi:bla regulator protein blaR1